LSRRWLACTIPELPVVPESRLKETKQGSRPLTEKELISAIKTGIAFVERGEYQQGYAALQASYGRATITLPADGLSHYGLCVAVLEKQTRKGVEFCRMAINEQFFNSSHFVNLVRLYVIRGHRKAAVEALQEGLHRLPDDAALLRVRDEIGYRESPVVTFLPRENPINATLGKIRAKVKSKAPVKKRG